MLDLLIDAATAIAVVVGIIAIALHARAAGALALDYLRDRFAAKKLAPTRAPAAPGCPPAPDGKGCGCPACAIRQNASQIGFAIGLVVSGKAPIVFNKMEAMTPTGMSAVSIAVMDDVLFERVVQPAVEAHLRAHKETP